MPISYHFDQAEKLCLRRCVGPMDVHEFSGSTRQILNRAHGLDQLDEVLDLGALTIGEDAVSFFVNLAENEAGLIREHSFKMRIAILAPDDEIFALARIFATHLGFLGLNDVTVLRDISQCAEWLDRSEASLLDAQNLT